MAEINEHHKNFIEAEISQLQARVNQEPEDVVHCINNLLTTCHKINDTKSEASLYHIIGTAHYRLEKLQDALIAYEKAFSIRKELNDEKGISVTLNNIGLVYYSLGLWDKATEQYLESLAIKERLNNPLSVGATLDNLGASYLRKANFKDAITALYKSLKIYEEAKDEQRTAITYQNIGFAHLNLGDRTYALQMYFKALDIKLKSDDYQSVIHLYNNIGIVYLDLKEYKEAEKYYQKCLDVSETHHYNNGISAACLNLALILKEENKLKESIEYFQKSIAISKSSNNTIELIPALSNLGNTLKIIGDTSESEMVLLEALTLAKEFKSLNDQIEIYKFLAELYEQKQDLEKSLDCYRKYLEAKDELLNVENTKAINELKTQYEVEKKEQETEIHRLKNIELKEALENLTIEKNRSEQLLLNILPASIANELKQNGKVKARNYEQATVMFVDVKNFTKHSVLFTPEEVVTEIDNCFQIFDAVIDKYAIEKIKTIGDAYLCASGIPEKTENNATIIINAALDMVAALENHYKNNTGIHFDFRFGVHTGPLIAGVVGKRKFEYDIWGDTVNTAARMEQSGEIGKINISEETYQLIKSDFVITERGEIEAKNKGLINMYFVEARK
jgi:class 3 adenylate cyclase/Tfp pilus assembly protein PilF